MRVLVTGGAGFIGRHVAAALAGAGHDVLVVDGLLPEAHGATPDRTAGPGWQLQVADVTDAAAMATAVRSVDAVCHLAALVGLGVDSSDAPRFARHTDLGTATVLAAMAAGGVRRLVLASSMVVYGEGHFRCPVDDAAHRPAGGAPGGPAAAPPRTAQDLAAGRFEPRCRRCAGPLDWVAVPEDAPLDPRSYYAASKAAQEHYARAWAIATGGVATALRYHNVYGPGMPRDTPYAGVAALFRSQLAAGGPPTVFEDGRQTRDFVHVHDVAAATAAAVAAAVPGPLNIGSGQPHTVGEFAALLAAAAGGPDPVVTGGYRLGDVRHIVASTERAATELGFRAAVPFAAGVTRFATDPLRGRD